MLTGVVVVAAPRAAWAQQAAKAYRIGFLRQGQPLKSHVDGFEQGLREHGYAVGQTAVLEFRYTADGSLEKLPDLAADLVRSNVDVILASASSAAMAAKQATTSVPIVFAGVSHPVEIGLVTSLRRPGGNLTGVAIDTADLAGKRLELLRQLVPTLTRVVMLSHPAHTSNRVQVDEMHAAARVFGMQLEVVPVRGPDDFDTAVKAVRGADGLMHVDAPLFATHRARLAEVIAKSRLPAVHPWRVYIEAGGLMSYGAHIPELYRRAAAYVDRIIKGAKPADLPVEQPTKFELLVNRKTAKTLGLTIPPLLLLRADQVID